MKLTQLLTVAAFLVASTLSLSVNASNERLLFNTAWHTVWADTTAKTVYKRNPIRGKVGAILAISCVVDDNNESYQAMNFVIGDKYTIPRKTAEIIGDMTFDPETLNSSKAGLKLVFSNGEEYIMPLTKRASGDVKLITLSAMRTRMTPDALSSFQNSRWVDVQVVYQGQSYKTFPAFSLENSGNAINNISNCYSI